MVYYFEIPASDEHILFLWILVCKFILYPIFGHHYTEYMFLACSLSTGNILNLEVMFLGLVYRGLNKSLLDTPLYKIHGVAWFLQPWLFSYFLDIRSSSLSSVGSSDSKSLAHCTTNLSGDALVSLFHTLGEERCYYLPVHKNISDHTWLARFISHQNKSFIQITDDARTACLHQRFVITGGSFFGDNVVVSLEFYNPLILARQFDFFPTILEDYFYFSYPLNEETWDELMDRRFFFPWLSSLLFGLVLSWYPSRRLLMIILPHLCHSGSPFMFFLLLL